MRLIAFQSSITLATLLAGRSDYLTYGIPLKEIHISGMRARGILDGRAHPEN
jgi:hypothetical protein